MADNESRTAGDDVSATKRQWQRYLAFLEDYSDPNPDAEGPRIEITTEVPDVERIERHNLGYLESRGLPPEWKDVGIVHESAFQMLVMDPVRFPDERLGTYLRLVSKPRPETLSLCCPSSRTPSCSSAIFRHGVRDWCLEVPRGSTIPGRTDEETARVELLEEIGARPPRTFIWSATCTSTRASARASASSITPSCWTSDRRGPAKASTA